MKRKNDDEMVQTAVRLPQSLHDRLSKAGGERGLGEEIRRRLEASFEAEKAPADPKTPRAARRNRLLRRGDRLVTIGSWSEDAFAFEVLKECVSMLLARLPTGGRGGSSPNPDGMLDIIFGPDYSPKPEEVSRLYVSAG